MPDRRVQPFVTASSAAGAPSFFPDLTGWECSSSSSHLEDFVPVDVAIIDDAPVISEAAQRTLPGQIRDGESWKDPDLDHYKL